VLFPERERLVLMDNDLIKFLLGERKAVELGGGNVISADRHTETWWQIILAHDGEEIFRLNYNPKAKQKEGKEPSKHTGGRKSYVMLMTKQLRKLKKSEANNKLELIGFITYLSDYIEWGTGRLINKRTKKPLRYEDLSKITELNNRKLNSIIADLKRLYLLMHTVEGYFLSPIIVKKGQTVKKPNESEGK
jgi:hypothetical protein